MIVSLQRTAYDEKASLRIYAKIDDVMALLAWELGLKILPPSQSYVPTIPKSAIVSPDIYLVPYNPKTGKRTSRDGKKMRWDLSVGSTVVVTAGPGKGYRGVVVGMSREGHYSIRLPCQREGSKEQGKVPRRYVLGSWWIEDAVAGRAVSLPLVNGASSRR